MARTSPGKTYRLVSRTGNTFSLVTRSRLSSQRPPLPLRHLPRSHQPPKLLNLSKSPAPLPPQLPLMSHQLPPLHPRQAQLRLPAVAAHPPAGAATLTLISPAAPFLAL